MGRYILKKNEDNVAITKKKDDGFPTTTEADPCKLEDILIKNQFTSSIAVDKNEIKPGFILMFFLEVIAPHFLDIYFGKVTLETI